MSDAAVLRYHPVARALHWALGLALIGVFALGLYMADLPFSPQRLKLYSWHKWAGVLVLTFTAVRLMWRLVHRPPALPAAIAQAMPAWQRGAHHATHGGLYLLFFSVPLLGWAYSSAAGFPIVLFGLWPLPDFVPVSETLAEGLKPLHRLSAYAMAALVLLHVAGALKHHFVDRDGLLLRMGWGGR
ncbi:cytochrome b [Hydrogenophaga taeniospiralis]|uniref:cytochrome b n=1 Tax=Hydrogenophaga taeniospiralis TaxID=65656 RepID=UPI001CFA50C2|nr:cytochrome b [Hydrogenophaga taeniospiralis]MCB4362860.1 cytochrome b [Hydrogenophaga taeniospiralis]